MTMFEYDVLMDGPRFLGEPQGLPFDGRVVIHISQLPNPPGRSEKKRSIRPSGDIHVTPPPEGLLTVGPRFTGVPQGSEGIARVLTQMPLPPGRSDEKKSSRPSAERSPTAAPEEPFTIGPRLTRGPQGASFAVRALALLRRPKNRRGELP